MRCKAIGRDFDRECEFLQGTYNGAAFDMALPLQKRLRKNNSHDGGCLEEEVRGAGEGDYLFYLSGALMRPQNFPLPPLLLQGVRGTTGCPSRDQSPHYVSRVPKGNDFASTNGCFYCQPKSGDNAGENGNRLRNVF